MIDESVLQQEGIDTTLSSTMGRGVLLSNSIGVLKKLESRVTGRFRTREGDKEYLQFIRAYAGLLTAINGIYRDSDLDKIDDKINQVMEDIGVPV